MTSSLLPPNSTEVERTVEGLTSHVRDLQVAIGDLWNPETCPVKFLPWLAWALSVDTWRSDWSEATKRAVIAASPRVHRLKGTVAAVKAAIAPFGHADLVEWFDDPEGEAAPYTFRISVAGDDIGGAALGDMISAIDAAKPARAHFGIDQTLLAPGGIQISGAARVASQIRLEADEDTTDVWGALIARLMGAYGVDRATATAMAWDGTEILFAADYARAGRTGDTTPTVEWAAERGRTFFGLADPQQAMAFALQGAELLFAGGYYREGPLSDAAPIVEAAAQRGREAYGLTDISDAMRFAVEGADLAFSQGFARTQSIEVGV